MLCTNSFCMYSLLNETQRVLSGASQSLKQNLFITNISAKQVDLVKVG